MQILLIGERYSENLGDAVICETVKNIIQSVYDNVEIDMLDISGRTNYNEYYQISQTRIDTLYWKIYGRITRYIDPLFYKLYISDVQRYRRTIRLFKTKYKKKYDLAIFAGGELFMDYFSGSIFYLARELSKRQCPIIFHACGMGELSNDSIELFQNTFNNPAVKAISLRDSFEKFKSLFATKNCLVTNTFDTALACSKYYSKSNQIVADFGVGVIGEGKYYEEQKKLISAFYTSDYSWKIFTNGAPWDVATARSILKELGVKETEISNYLVDRPLTAQELIYSITSFKRVISYRMHSQIVALTYLIPCYSFAWDSKVHTLFNKMKLEKYCFNPDEVCACLDVIKNDSFNIADLKEQVKKAADNSAKTLLKEILFATSGNYDT